MEYIQNNKIFVYNFLLNVIITFFIFFLFNSLSAQDVFLVSDGGEVTACSGTFYDSSQSTTYQANEDYIITFCPENEGDVVLVEFIALDIQCLNTENCDQLLVYDADNVDSNLLGEVSELITYTASATNNSGCLTFHFTSDETLEGFGWIALISCQSPCDRPIALASTFPDEDIPIKVCIGEGIQFDGSNSFAAKNYEIDEILWDFQDGFTDSVNLVTSHSFGTAGEYIVQLYLIDDNGCASTNRTDIQVWVATEPNWIIDYPLGQATCLGDSLCLNLDVEHLGVIWNGPNLSVNADELLDPNSVGGCLVTNLSINSFAPGQQIENIYDLASIYLDFEHSFMGDLLIQITCPDSTTVNLHEQGGGSINLGIPVQESDGAPGIGMDYWWSSNAINGTWE